MEKNQLSIKSAINSDELFCVLLDSIYPLRVMTRVREKDIVSQNKKKTTELRDFVITIKDNMNMEEEIKNEYIVGLLLKNDNGVFFRPLCSKQLILLASDCVDNSDNNIIYPFTFNFDSFCGEIKYLTIDELKSFIYYYPDNYGESDKIRNLVLKNALCVEIKDLQLFRNIDKEISDKILQIEYIDEVLDKLKREKKNAQKILVNDYLEGYEFYDNLDIEEVAEKKKQLIKSAVK